MNQKKVLIVAGLSLTVALFIVLHRNAVRTPATAPRGVPTDNGAERATPKVKGQDVNVELVGITTILNVKKAFLKVQWPADVSRRGDSYILSEGESQDGITVETIDAGNNTVKLQVLQTAKILKLDKSA